MSSPEAIRQAQEVPAMIAGNVNLMRFSEALARAGIVGRYDPERHVLVIEPAPERCRACGGSGLDDDARCGFCGGAGHAQDGAILPPQKAQERPRDSLVGMVWYNGLTRQERSEWHRRAGSAVPADAREAYKSGGCAMIHLAEEVAAFLFLAFVAIFILVGIVVAIDDEISKDRARMESARLERLATEWARGLTESEAAQWLPMATRYGLITAWRTAMANREKGAQ